MPRHPRVNPENPAQAMQGPVAHEVHKLCGLSGTGFAVRKEGRKEAYIYALTEPLGSCRDPSGGDVQQTNKTERKPKLTKN